MSKIKAKFTLNPDYRNLVMETGPSEASLSSGLSHVGHLIYLARMPLMLIGLMMCIVVALRYDEQQSRLFFSDVLQTQAEVTGCTEQLTRDLESVSYITVSYRYNVAVGGRVYNGTLAISHLKTCTEYPLGVLVPLFYHPSNPSEASFDGYLAGSPVQGFLYFGLTGLTLFLIPQSISSYHFIRLYLIARQDARQRIRKGLLLEGEIMEVDGKHDGGSSMVTVHYVFITPEQKRLEGWTSAYRPDLPPERFPIAGTPIVVLYVDDRDHRAL